MKYKPNCIQIRPLFAASIIMAIVLIMEAASASETSVNFYQTTGRNPEDGQLQPIQIVYHEIYPISPFP
jgi:hypothetical protein